MRLFLVFVIFFTVNVYAKKKKINYRYKKYERFDFEALDVEGSDSSPGDLSIGPRFKKRFKNKIPERKNFNREMRKAIDSIL